LGDKEPKATPTEEEEVVGKNGGSKSQRKRTLSQYHGGKKGRRTGKGEVAGFGRLIERWPLTETSLGNEGPDSKTKTQKRKRKEKKKIKIGGMALNT